MKRTRQPETKSKTLSSSSTPTSSKIQIVLINSGNCGPLDKNALEETQNSTNIQKKGISDHLLDMNIKENGDFDILKKQNIIEYKRKNEKNLLQKFENRYLYKKKLLKLKNRLENVTVKPCAKVNAELV